MKKPKALVLRGSATNCDIETANAFAYAGARAELAHINEFLSGKKSVLDYDIMAFPGGFSYGDDISAGKIFSVKLEKISGELEKFVKDKRPVIGICNGFQIMVKAGLLPQNKKRARTATLFTNDCGHFLAKWIKLKVNPRSPCIFTKGLPSEIELPMAHGEGKFITDNSKTLSTILKSDLYALTYSDNPNGSMADIAGICSPGGTVFGLMPHPERNFFAWQHPDRKKAKETLAVGYQFFKNAVEYLR